MQSQLVRLKYDERHQARCNGQWADKICAALISLLKDSGHYSSVIAQAGFDSVLSFYDWVAGTLVGGGQLSAAFAEQTAGLLGHMLVLLGRGGEPSGAVKVGSLVLVLLSGYLI